MLAHLFQGFEQQLCALFSPWRALLTWCGLRAVGAVLVRVALTPLWSAHVISFCLSQPNSFGPVMGPAFALM